MQERGGRVSSSLRAYLNSWDTVSDQYPVVFRKGTVVGAHVRAHRETAVDIPFDRFMEEKDWPEPLQIYF
jgi:hypothetical protein